MTKSQETCLFEFICDQSWDELNTTTDPNRRHCMHCHRDVVFCSDLEDLAECQEKKECVCYAPWANGGEILLGMLTERE